MMDSRALITSSSTFWCIGIIRCCAVLSLEYYRLLIGSSSKLVEEGALGTHKKWTTSTQLQQLRHNFRATQAKHGADDILAPIFMSQVNSLRTYTPQDLLQQTGVPNLGHALLTILVMLTYLLLRLALFLISFYL